MVNEFNEYVREAFSVAGDIVIKPMMGGYLVYLNGKLIGDICGNELFLKRTPTSDRLLADSELRYPYEGSKTLMHVFSMVLIIAAIVMIVAGIEYPAIALLLWYFYLWFLYGSILVGRYVVNNN